MRAGTYVQQPSGYKAFIPAMLPPKPPVTMGAEMVRLLSDADRALGRLDGVATVLPNPDLFVAMYVRQEAVFSSQIEGTQSTLEDVLEFEAGGASRVAERIKDVDEVVRYVAAINHGLQRLPKLPLSLRLIREIHKKLLKGGGIRRRIDKLKDGSRVVTETRHAELNDPLTAGREISRLLGYVIERHAHSADMGWMDALNEMSDEQLIREAEAAGMTDGDEVRQLIAGPPAVGRNGGGR